MWFLSSRPLDMEKISLSVHVPEYFLITIISDANSSYTKALEALLMAIVNFKALYFRFLNRKSYYSWEVKECFVSFPICTIASHVRLSHINGSWIWKNPNWIWKIVLPKYNFSVSKWHTGQKLVWWIWTWYEKHGYIITLKG